MALRSIETGSSDARAGAAVAIVVRQRASTIEALFLERARRDGDPWSGHVAFPGGLCAPGESALETAIREAHEEAGLTLSNVLGRLSDQWTIHPRTRRPMRVRPFVMASDEDPIVDGREAVDAFWAPISIARQARWKWRRIRKIPFLLPEVPVQGRTLWGLTLAMTRELDRRLGDDARAVRAMCARGTR